VLGATGLFSYHQGALGGLPSGSVNHVDCQRKGGKERKEEKTGEKKARSGVGSALGFPGGAGNAQECGFWCRSRQGRSGILAGRGSELSEGTCPLETAAGHFLRAEAVPFAELAPALHLILRGRRESEKGRSR